MNEMALTKADLSLLATYADGPRIWDATSLMAAVHRLLSLDLIEPVQGGSALRLTTAGRAMLEETS